MHTRLLLLTATSLLSAALLSTTSCKSNEQNDDNALVVEDGQKYPGNDGGKEIGDTLDANGTTTVGGVNSYTDADSADVDNYNKALAADPDNPNFNQDNTRTGGDPMTPNAPLADGSAGRLKNTGVNAADDDGEMVPASQSTGAQRGNRDLNSDSPYGSNQASIGNQTTVGSDAANRPRAAAYGGGDVKTYVNTLYAGVPNNDNPAGDHFDVSTYRPAVSASGNASYAETKRKFVAVPGQQNYVAYAPVTPTFTPVLSWDAPAGPATAPMTLAERNAETLRAIPRFGADCGNAADPAACSAEALDKVIRPLLNDPRVSRSIASGSLTGLAFELDAQGRVVANSIRAEKGGKACNDADCDRLRALMSAVLTGQTWTPGEVNGAATGTLVYLPLSVMAVKAS